ncbi:MAG: YraN family protein [Desulfobacter sp.]|nr:YraN family protein [Desulfobacter sp.]
MGPGTQELGHRGEAAACKFLESSGLTILKKNYRTQRFEIDIIAKENDTLCFVEVKTRTSLKKGLPRESVGHAKQLKIIMGASYYLKANKLTRQGVRFDVVEVFYAKDDPDAPQINLIRNAFSGG